MILRCGNEVVDRAEYAARVIENRTAGVGQSQAAAGALEQDHPEFSFQFGYLRAERGLGHAARLRGPGNAPVAFDRDDVGEVSNVHVK